MWARTSAEGAYLLRQEIFAEGIRILAVLGHAEDWAAYYGPLDWISERVQREGDKLGEMAAERLFPFIAGALSYRN